MRYLYDSDALIDYLSDHAGARARFQALLADGLAVSAVTLIELYTGIYGARHPQQAERELRAVLGAMTILNLNRHNVRRTARLRHDLLLRRLPIKHRAYDLLAAATALACDLTFVTSNTRDYEDIAGLT